MAINVSYTPQWGAVAQVAYQGGQGQYAEKRRMEQLQRDLEAQRLNDSKYRADLSATNDQYLAQIGNIFNQTNQARGFQNANYQQTQSIADAQLRQQADITATGQRQQADIANQQGMQQAGFGQQSKLADQQENLSRWTTEFGGQQQQAIQARQIESEMQRLQASIQDAQSRQQNALAAERMGQLSQLQAAARQQASQQSFQADALQFGLGADLIKSQQQGQIQSGLSAQGYGQDVGMQQLRGDQAMGLQQENFLQNNFLGEYAPAFQTMTARQAMVKDQELMRNQQILQQAAQSGQITQAAYAQANNELIQHRTGLRQQLNIGDGDLAQAAFMEKVRQWPAGQNADGSPKTFPVWEGPNGPQALEDPMVYRELTAANKVAELNTARDAARLSNMQSIRSEAMKVAMEQYKLHTAAFRTDQFPFEQVYLKAAAMFGDEEAIRKMSTGRP